MESQAGRSPRPSPSASRATADVVVLGGGIIGCAAAAIMADRGASVILVERTSIGAGASGRNLGAIQHPFDPVLAPLYRESLTRYRALAETHPEFRIGREPAGLLLLNADAGAAAAKVATLRRTTPELEPELLTPEEVVAAEPSLAPGPAGIRLATGFPVPPAAATQAWADLAQEHGASIRVGQGGRPLAADGTVAGVVLEDGTVLGAGAVLIAAGPWTPPLVDPDRSWRPIRPTYGVTLQVRLGDAAPRHVVEEDEVDAINRADAATAHAADAATNPTSDLDPPSLFSLATAAGVSTLGSTFLPVEPDVGHIEALLLRRGAAFLPAIGEAEVIDRRMCERPQSADGRPFIGPVDGLDGLFVCAGHGPWGISTGPASAAIAARSVLDGTPVPPELAASRPV